MLDAGDILIALLTATLFFLFTSLTRFICNVIELKKLVDDYEVFWGLSTGINKIMAGGPHIDRNDAHTELIFLGRQIHSFHSQIKISSYEVTIGMLAILVEIIFVGRTAPADYVIMMIFTIVYLTFYYFTRIILSNCAKRCDKMGFYKLNKIIEPAQSSDDDKI
jgi:hypothetical protein